MPLWFGRPNRWDTLPSLMVFPCPWMESVQGVQSVFIPSHQVSSCWHGWSVARVVTLGTAIEQHFWQPELGNGFTIGVVLILAMLLTMWATRKRTMKKVSFLSEVSDPLSSYLLFDLYAFNKGERYECLHGLYAWAFQRVVHSRLMLILSETFLLTFLSALIATVIGTFGAIYIYQSEEVRTICTINNILMVAWTLWSRLLLDSLYDGEVPARFLISSG